MARKMWRTLEPYHGLVYFAPEATSAYEALGVMGFDGYFASRAAPMGPVPAEVVVATFFNFNHVIVQHAIPAAWQVTTPEQLIAARFEAAGRALRRAAGPLLEDPSVARAADLARAATGGCTTAGRPLYAGHAAVAWPDDPVLELWHAVSLLREFRGDGHIACLVEGGLDGIEALVFHAASGDVPRAALQGSRQWDDAAWEAAVERLGARGWVQPDGSFTEAGAAQHQRIEDRTDELALAPWQTLGEERCDELRALVRPLSKAIVAGGTFGLR
jgi:hypothetical protein